MRLLLAALLLLIPTAAAADLEIFVGVAPEPRLYGEAERALPLVDGATGIAQIRLSGDVLELNLTHAEQLNKAGGVTLLAVGVKF